MSVWRFYYPVVVTSASHCPCDINMTTTTMFEEWLTAFMSTNISEYSVHKRAIYSKLEKNWAITLMHLYLCWLTLDIHLSCISWREQITDEAVEQTRCILRKSFFLPSLLLKKTVVFFYCDICKTNITGKLHQERLTFWTNNPNYSLLTCNKPAAQILTLSAMWRSYFKYVYECVRRLCYSQRAGKHVQRGNNGVNESSGLSLKLVRYMKWFVYWRMKKGYWICSISK